MFGLGEASANTGRTFVIREERDRSTGRRHIVDGWCVAVNVAEAINHGGGIGAVDGFNFNVGGRTMHRMLGARFYFRRVRAGGTRRPQLAKGGAVGRTDALDERRGVAGGHR